MKRIIPYFLLVAFFLGLPAGSFAANESEPNGTFATANSLPQDTVMNGSGGAGDDDYFRSLPLKEGTIKIYFTWSGGTPGSNIYVYAYNKAQGGIGTRLNYSTASGTDSLIVYCRQADSIYLRVYNSAAMNYQIHYTVVETGVGDTEPNNTFAQATYFAATDTAKGRIGYSANTIDNDDFYKTKLPDDGTLKIYVDKINTGNATGNFYIFAYNKAQGGIGTLLKYSQPTGNTKDTLTIHCRQADSVYIRLYADQCFSYKLHYEVVPSGTNDTEPNNTFAQATYFAATDTAKGRIGYSANTIDNDDFYKTKLPDDGTLKIYIDKINTGNATGNFYIFAYNKAQGGIGTLLKYSQPTGNTKDTLTIHCRQADSVYIRLYADQCFSYKLHYEVVPSGTNDTEPNNTFEQATYFAATDTAKGRIGYSANTIDNDDFYKTKLPDDGTLKIYIDKINTGNATGNFYIFAYNKAQGGIGTLLKYSQPLGNTKDTLTIHCRQADSVYIRLYADQCFSYKLHYEVVPSGTNDTEPNNTQATAPLISLSDTLKGRTGYSANSIDNYDFFRFKNEERSQITAYVAYNNTSNTTANLYLFFLAKNGGTLFSRYKYSVPPGIGRDTLVLNCAPADTLGFEIYADACFSYEARFKVKKEQPEAKILAARTGNEFGFSAQIQQADTVAWDFGNGQKSTFLYPTQTFIPGGYLVKLKATNRTCNLSTTDSLLVEVQGIETYLPKKAGVGGDLLMTIYGGGLTDSTKVRLLKGGQALTPFSVSANDRRNTLSANFDVHLVPAGLYDLEITIPGTTPVVFAGGMQLDSFSYPYCRAEITGPTRWRINRETPFELKITNRGNVYGNGVVVGFVYPKSVQVRFGPKLIRLNKSQNSTVELDGKAYSVSNAFLAPYRDSSAVPTPIDSFDGKPYDGYALLLQIPKVLPNSTVSMPFFAESADVGNAGFHAYTLHPNIFGSCETPHWANQSNMFMSEAIDALDMAAGEVKGVGWLGQAFTKTLKIGQKHLAVSGAMAGAHFDAWWNGYEVTAEMHSNLNAELDEANAFGIKTFTEEAGDVLLTNRLEKLQLVNADKRKWWYKQLNHNHKAGNSPEILSEFLKKADNVRDYADRLEQLEGMYKTSKNLKALNDKIIALMTLLEDCPELEPQLVDLLKLLDEELEHQDPNDKTTNRVVSMDPNAIYGPEGVLSARFRKGADPMHYMIACENVDTAQAAAQVVRIVDTLDPSKFDLSTFEFGNVYIGNKAIRLLNGRNEFFGELSLYPAMPLKARIIAKLNKTTGVITWDMVGVDTATGKLPYDPDLGLLPPNTAPPVGEAQVSYSVRLKAGLPSGTEVRNSALIYFDDNEPIATNIWSNTLDDVNPQSGLTAILEQDTLIRLRLSGTDAQSGIQKYRVFVQSDSSAWQNIGIANADTMTVTGERGKTYRFSVASIDNVGNTEIKTPRNEAEVTVPPAKDGPGGPGGSSAFVLYPNPSTGQLFVRSSQDRTGATIALTDYTGRVVETRTQDFKVGGVVPLDLSNYANGMYLIRISGGGGATETYKVVLAVPRR